MGANTSWKCIERSCPMRYKLRREAAQEIRSYAHERGFEKVSAICPKHVKEALRSDDEGYQMDISLEEYLVEAAKDRPRWRLVLVA